MSLRNRFPFDKIFKVLDKIVEIAGYLKLIFSIFKKDKRDGD